MKTRMSPQEIIELRKKYGQSQEEFAHTVGVTRLTLARWETGETVPIKICQKRLWELKEILT